MQEQVESCSVRASSPQSQPVGIGVVEVLSKIASVTIYSWVIRKLLCSVLSCRRDVNLASLRVSFEELKGGVRKKRVWIKENMDKLSIRKNERYRKGGHMRTR
jgi:hypothetical protein